VLIVERPGDFRDHLQREVSQRGATAHVRDDAMEALASIERLTPQIVVVSDDPGPPGALGLCRMLQRKLTDVAVYRLGEPSLSDPLDEHSLLLPRAVGASALAAAIFDKAPAAGPYMAHRAWEGDVASLELGPLLLAIEMRWLTGRLLITRPGTEREIVFVRGKPVYARSSVLSERLGAIGVRRGLVTEAQVDQALDIGRARGLRLGAALLESGALDATRLYRLLAAQLLEQLTAACNAGASHARFVLDQSALAHQPILRMSPLTALLHGVAVTPPDDVERVLDELGDHALRPEPPRPVEQWLRDLGVSEPDKLSERIENVRALRAFLRDAELNWPPDVPGITRDVLALALLRSGTFRMPSELSVAQVDVRGGIRSLSPPSIVSAVVRCSQSDFSHWPVSALARVRSPTDAAIDEYLHGQRSAEQARALALLGPEADCDERLAEVYAVALSEGPLPIPASALDPARTPTLSELRLRCHAQLKRLDTLEAEHSGALTRVHLLQARTQVERALRMLPARESLSIKPPAREPSHPPPLPLPLPTPANDVRAPSPPPPPPPKPKFSDPVFERPTVEMPDQVLLRAAEPLMQQGQWRELRLLLATKTNDPGRLAPIFALLYAIALKEDATLPPEDPKQPGPRADTIGLNVVSQLLMVPQDSAAATLITRRLLRPRPRDLNPPLGVLGMLALAVLMLGALVGFVLHSELVSLVWK
jgi:hypothetical protein